MAKTRHWTGQKQGNPEWSKMTSPTAESRGRGYEKSGCQDEVRYVAVSDGSVLMGTGAGDRIG
jgi:hypothetical protein